MVDVMRTGWANMQRASLGFQAMTIAGSMTAEQLYSDLENSSLINHLERRYEILSRIAS